jgi:O-antigen ligase
VGLVGVLLVVFVLLVRPQEFVPALQAFSVLNAVTALTVFCVAFETVILGKLRPPWTPQVPWLVGFIAWCFLVTVVRLGPAGFTVVWEAVGLSAIFMMTVVAAAGTLLRWRIVAVVLIAVGALISCVCVHQAQQPAECIAIDTSSTGGERSGEGTSDGRACDNEYICEAQGKPHTAYACEKVGLAGTFTEGLRVRWRGTLGDPNELALLLGALMPLAFAVAGIAGRRTVTAAVTGVVGLSLWCVVLTGSRGGQLVVLTVFGAYFVRRYGLRGVLMGAIFALPVMLFGGRAGEEADSSSLERIGLLYEGMDMIRAYPVLGVGVSQFTDHAFGAMTAHNSYVLAAAELGLPGCLLWSMLVYVSIKIAWQVAASPPESLDALDPRFRPLARALFVAFLGILVGIFFLSFCYKAVLFVYFGLSGALFVAVRQVCPDFDVRVSAREIAWVAGADAALLVFVFVYSRWQMSHAS